MLSQVRSFIGKTPLKRNDCDLLSLTAAIVTDKKALFRSAPPILSRLDRRIYCPSRRYSRGVLPFTALNAAANLLALSYPTRPAISATPAWGSCRSRRAARSMRRHRI